MSRTLVRIALVAGFLALINNAYAAETLADSVMELQQGADEEIFGEVVLEAQKDPQKTFMQHIVTHVKHPALWEPLARMGLDKNKITAADLFFIIREISKPNFIIEKERAKKIFDRLIIGHLRNPLKSREITQLLTDVSIVQPEGWASPFSAPRSKEARNVLIECVEMGFMEAFGAIMIAWPENLIDLHKLPAVTFTAKVVDEKATGFRTAYKDAEQKHLNLVDWLMRDDGSYHTYMKGSYKNPNYIKAAQHVLNYVKVRETAETKGDLLGMAALLDEQKELPKEFSFKNLIARIHDTTGINWDAIEVDQRENIRGKLPQKK